MKIAMLISSLDGGGAAKIVSNISRQLPEDWETDIILNHDKNIAFPYNGNIISLSIPLTRDKTNLIYQCYVFIKRLITLRRLKKEKEYDCCISYMDSANLVNILTPCGKCKTIINVVNNMTECAKYSYKYRYIVNPVIKLFYNKADNVIALSNEVKADLIANYGINSERISVSYCSINVEEIDHIIKENNTKIESEWFKKNRTVITAGRMETQKGQWHLIRAFSRVVNKVPDAKLIIFGEGSKKEYFEKLISEYELQNNTKLIGFDPELVAYISKSAIFVFPSLYEGFGTALQEALACNVACIATDYVSGGREQLDPSFKGQINEVHMGEYGVLVSRCSADTPMASKELDKNEEELAQAIIALLEDGKLRNVYSEKARRRCFDFDINAIAEEWIKNIERIVS